MSKITVDDVINIHDEILKKNECQGVNYNSLQGTLKRVDSQIEYDDVNDFYITAAWYGISIAKGHAFIDGNKRTALVTMLTFLDMQDIKIKSNIRLDDLMVCIVKCKKEHKKIAVTVSKFLYKHKIVTLSP